MFSLVFKFSMKYFHGNLNSFTVRMPGEHIARKWETIFAPLPLKHSSFTKPPLRPFSATRDPLS